MSSPEVLDLEELAGVEALSRDWLDLAARIEGSSYFQTPDWVLAWWDTIAERPRTRLAAWRSPSGRLEAMVALSRGRERLHRRLPFAVPVYTNAGSGVGAADHCAWLVPAERGAEVAAWLTEATRRRPASRPRPPPRTGPSRSLPAGARVVDAAACPRVALPLETGPGRTVERLRPSAAALHAAARARGGELRVGAAVAGGRPAPGGALRAPRPGAAGRPRLVRRRAARPPSPPGRERRGGTRARGGGRAAGGSRSPACSTGSGGVETFAAYQSGWDRTLRPARPGQRADPPRAGVRRRPRRHDLRLPPRDRALQVPIRRAATAGTARGSCPAVRRGRCSWPATGLGLAAAPRTRRTDPPAGSPRASG